MKTTVNIVGSTTLLKPVSPQFYNTNWVVGFPFFTYYFLLYYFYDLYFIIFQELTENDSENTCSYSVEAVGSNDSSFKLFWKYFLAL